MRPPGELWGHRRLSGDVASAFMPTLGSERSLRRHDCRRRRHECPRHDFPMRLLAAMLVWAAMLAAQPPKILVHGHRGARAMRPENTLPAFEYAIGAGVDVIELDM